jgi:F0F1-type ATP synthase assembly protein I
MRLLFYLLSLNFEIVTFILLGVFGGRYLNDHHATGFDWLMISLPLSGVMVVHCIYRFWQVLHREISKNSGEG